MNTSTSNSSMYYVYLIRSLVNSSKTYIGHTENLKQRLQAHNSGNSKFTKLYYPWGAGIIPWI